MVVYIMSVGDKCSTQSPEDRAWWCNTAVEAESMVRWLRDNHVTAVMMSKEAHEEITKRWIKANTI